MDKNSFYSIAEFFVRFRFTTLSERKVSLLEKNFNVSSRRNGVKLPACVFIFFLSLSLPLLSTFVEIFNEYMNVELFKKFPFVFLKSAGHATSRRRRVNLSMAFHNGLHGGGRMDERSDSDVITKTKIFCIHGFTKFS